MFTNGENHQGKTPQGDFKVTTPKNPLLSKQVVTSKGITVPYTNLQLNPYSGGHCPSLSKSGSIPSLNRYVLQPTQPTII